MCTLYLERFHRFTSPSDSNGELKALLDQTPFTKTVIFPRRTRELMVYHCINRLVCLRYCVTFGSELTLRPQQYIA